MDARSYRTPTDSCLHLHELQDATDDTHREEREDDGYRGDLLLEQPAAEQCQPYGGNAGDQLVKVLLERGDLLGTLAVGAKGRVLGQGLLDALGA